MDENIVRINEQLHIGIDKEWHIRDVKSEGRIPIKGQYLTVKFMEEMTPQEIDSLTRLHPLPRKQPIYNVDDARKRGSRIQQWNLFPKCNKTNYLKKGILYNFRFWIVFLQKPIRNSSTILFPYIIKIKKE